MKKLRLIALSVVVIVALFAAMIPVLAAPPTIPLNLSFEADTNLDGVPDKWNVRGNAVHVCGHGHPSAYDNCLMAFGNSASRAAVYQIIAEDGWVIQEEGVNTVVGYVFVAAKHLPANRAFAGYIMHLANEPAIRIYNTIPAGSYDFTEMPIIRFGDYPNEPNNEINTITWGVLVKSGSGAVYVDYFTPFIEVLP